MRELYFRRAHVLLVVLIAMAASVCGDRAAERAGATARAKAQAEEAEAKARTDAAAARETQRLAALWTYHDEPAGAGRQVTAAINSADDVDTNGQGARRVQLVFRDHPEWGRSSYLVLQAGDFDCYRGCPVAVSVDEAAPTAMAARRPRTDEAIAMFVNDWRALWRMMSGATRIRVSFPVTAGGTRTASFDVAGLDRSKMPAWDELAAQSHK